MSAPATALVTGAGRGLGAAIATALARLGHTVGVLDVDVAGIDTTVAAINASADPGRAVGLEASTTDEEAVERALDALTTAAGTPPSVVVNNAGIVRFGPLLTVSVTDWRSVVDVNLTGTFVVSRAVVRRLQERRDQNAEPAVTQAAGSTATGLDARIVNITSMNGVAPGPNAGAYGATKAAIALLTQQMAIEWGPLGVRVNAVAPGLIDAGMSEPLYADPETRVARESKVPLGRLGTSADIAAAVTFLLSDAAAYVTGQNLIVDGGVTMSMIANLPRPRAVDTIGHRDA